MAVERPRRPHELPLDLLEHRPSGRSLAAGLLGEVQSSIGRPNAGQCARRTGLAPGANAGHRRSATGSAQWRGHGARNWTVRSAPKRSGWPDRPSDGRSSLIRSVLMANAASAPSAAATMTHCTAREASPATKSPEVRRLVLAGAHGALVVELAAQTHRQLRPLGLAGREEQRAAGQRARRRRTRCARSMPSRPSSRATRSSRSAMPLRSSRARSVPVDLGRTVGAQHEVAAPGGQLERQSETARARAVDGDRLVAHLPAVAVRTVKHAAAVELAEARRSRAGCRTRRWRSAACATRTSRRRERHRERGRRLARGAATLDIAQLDGVVCARAPRRAVAGTRAAACRRGVR